ncbi:MAG: hypothetical protein ACAI43_09745 [Phycisphaerae bacterium]|nr:hypothetical protein [Tepidisphaeraceae bacterium]
MNLSNYTSLATPSSATKATSAYAGPALAAVAVAPARPAAPPAAPATVLKGTLATPALEWAALPPTPARARSSDGISRLIAVTQLKDASANASVIGKLQVTGTGISGPRTRPAVNAAAAAGIADLAMELGAGEGLSRAGRAALENTLDRVVRDVCAKYKPGDDLLGNVRTAVGFALWGAGVAPEKMAAVTGELTRLLGKYFPGNDEQAMTKMAQYFSAHAGWEVIIADKMSGLGQFFPAAR